jgi:protein-L-isoaspartate(D-aspartate) O-methyltransferase
VRRTPRELFVPQGHEPAARGDQPVPLPHGQTTSQPSLQARMIEALELTGEERVLEVGTGYGYQTALLARLAGAVWSVEWYADLADAARANLDRQGIDNVTVVVGDGTNGWAPGAPYDAIVVSAAFPEVPPALVSQLVLGGRLVMPRAVGGPGSRHGRFVRTEVVLLVRRGTGLEQGGVVSPAFFVAGHGSASTSSTSDPPGPAVGPGR